MDEINQVASEIKARIKALEDLCEGELNNEMAQLKRSLLDNPSACLLLQDEDIGIMVDAIRKQLGMAIVSATTSKPTRAKAATKQTAQSALDLLSMEL